MVSSPLETIQTLGGETYPVSRKVANSRHHIYGGDTGDDTSSLCIGYIRFRVNYGVATVVAKWTEDLALLSAYDLPKSGSPAGAA